MLNKLTKIIKRERSSTKALPPGSGDVSSSSQRPRWRSMTDEDSFDSLEEGVGQSRAETSHRRSGQDTTSLRILEPKVFTDPLQEQPTQAQMGVMVEKEVVVEHSCRESGRPPSTAEGPSITDLIDPPQRRGPVRTECNEIHLEDVERGLHEERWEEEEKDDERLRFVLHRKQELVDEFKKSGTEYAELLKEEQRLIIKKARQSGWFGI